MGCPRAEEGSQEPPCSLPDKRKQKSVSWWKVQPSEARSSACPHACPSLFGVTFPKPGLVGQLLFILQDPAQSDLPHQRALHKPRPATHTCV